MQPAASQLITAAGPRAAERALLDLVENWRARRADELREPIRIVVPSRSVRLHVAARLAAGGRPLAGVVVETLGGLARAVLERGGSPLRTADGALELLARRFAADEPTLVAGLGGLADPFASVVASARDLLDAGLGGESAAAALELLGGARDEDVTEAADARAAAVVRVAERVLAAAGELGFDLASTGLARAAVELAGGAALPARAIAVYGFADTTGVAGDLVDALLRRGGTTVVVDLPPDPAGGDAGVFAARFLERATRAAAVRAEASVVAPAELRLLEAGDPDAEVREVAERVRALLDGGAPAEGVGLVVREVGLRLSLLVRHLDRLAVPFSGVSLAAPGGGLRVRIGGLLEVLASGGEAAADRWREAISGLDASFEEAAALRTLGASRLDDLARIEPPEGGVRLPLAAAGDDAQEEGGGPVRPLRVDAGPLSRQRAGAREAVELLAGWPESARPAEHALRTARLLACGGGWPEEAERVVHEALETCAAELAGVGPVSRAEWVRALGWTTRELARVAVGGHGGGVQVLGAMEARARTFDHLFVLGLQRESFPRRIAEDPLLPDRVRRRLETVLPELPVKSRGHQEERYLFAQLASSSPRVTLSWAASGARGASPASPFVEELRARHLDVERAPARERPGGRRTVWEHALECGQRGGREAWSAALAGALAEGWRRLGQEAPPVSGAAASGLSACVEEVERSAPEAGPYLGALGAGALGPARSLSVTAVEGFARCPWRAFLTRGLGVAPMPDPLLNLPAADRRLLGTVVHAVLGRRAVECGAGRSLELGEALRRQPARLLPADPEWIDRAVAEAARETVRREGMAFPGLAPLIAMLARPFVAAALEIEAGAEVLAAEAGGEARVGGVDLRFRADRVDGGGAEVVLTDYKTGRPRLARLKTERGRRGRLLEEIGRGETLQAGVYAAAGDGFAGRYLYLDPEQGEGALEVVVPSGDDEAGRRLEAAVGAVREAMEAGAAFPRTSQVVRRRSRKGGPGGEPALRESPWCASCPVREACVRDDSGLRGRVEAWLGEDAAAGEGVDGAARRLWRIGTETEEEEDG